MACRFYVVWADNNNSTTTDYFYPPYTTPPPSQPPSPAFNITTFTNATEVYKATASDGIQYILYQSELYGVANFSSGGYDYTTWNDTLIFLDNGTPTQLG
jgi:hypothetical protein